MPSLFRAQLSSFHTANPDNKWVHLPVPLLAHAFVSEFFLTVARLDFGSPFTVYVVTVQKGAAQWHVFRRYKEWEELRAQLNQVYGTAPAMPPKQLFGRMRPEVSDVRVT